MPQTQNLRYYFRNAYVGLKLTFALLFRNAYVGLRRRPSCGAKRRLTARPTQDRAFVSETLVHKIAVHKVAVDKAAGR